MTKSRQAFISFFIIVLAVLWSLFGRMPLYPDMSEGAQTEFSTARAMKHVEALGGYIHYVGSPGHERAQEYIVKQLEKLGLTVEIQTGTSLSKKGVLTQPENIIAKIEGSGDGKALLLLTHYDSAVHSSYGASDAASGVATILEGVRAYLTSGARPTNDILIVITDAEELGLNGAELFVRKHPLADQVGVALNFEARGSGGPSFMLLETLQGNEKLIKHFQNAAPDYPVTNSLAYSVYKMLPNDTDLTVLREEAKIPGYNYAFIDDHFDYHTAQDIPENLDVKSLAHQGSYLMPLLEYFGQVSLNNFSSEEDLIYFDFPLFNLISYPFSWRIPMLIGVILLLIGVVFYGLALKNFKSSIILRGLLPLVLSLGLSGLLAYLLWKFCLFVYPQYLEMENPFPYNGYYYLAAVIVLSLGICFYVYNRFRDEKNHGEFFVAPLVLWILIGVLVSYFLPGASYLIIPVFFGILQLIILVIRKKPNLLLMSFLSLPPIFLLLPLIISFPVALGLGILFVSAILVVLLWVLFWPVFRGYRKLQLLGFFCILTFFVLLVVAHMKSEFTEERPKPNSLVYLFDADQESATWKTYDTMEDSWTAPYFEVDLAVPDGQAELSSKYGSGFSKTSRAPLIDIKEPEVLVRKNDSIGGTGYKMSIIPHRDINRIEIFTKGIVDFEEFRANGLEGIPLTSEENPLHIFKRRWTERLLTYYATSRDTLELEFKTREGKLPEFVIYEASNDLLENRQLQVPPREPTMIPRPFVLNDAVIVKKTIRLE